MFSSIVNVVVSGIAACFSWFDALFAAMPGALEFILAFFAIFIINRFILGPIVGATVRAGASDMVRKAKSDIAKKREFNRSTRESYNEMKES